MADDEKIMGISQEDDTEHIQGRREALQAQLFYRINGSNPS